MPTPSLICSICGDRPNELKLMLPTYRERDECPCQFVDWEGKAKGKCGGILLNKPKAPDELFELQQIARQMIDLLWRVQGGETRISSYQLHSWERQIDKVQKWKRPSHTGTT